MYKVISFDIGGTLLDTEANDRYGLSELTKLIDRPYDMVTSAYKNVFQKKRKSLLELVNLFCDVLNIDLTDGILEFFVEKYSDKNNKVKINPLACEVIQKLKNMGYKIILFSNSCCLINPWIDDVMESVDNVFYSYDLGYTKSDCESYRIIEEKMDCKSSEILHIGDTLESDYIKPMENGWHALYYGKVDDSSVVSIESLDKVFEML